MSTAGVLLAAGSGSRFAGAEHKLLISVRGRPLYRWALEHALAAGLDELIVVTGAAVLDLPPSVTVAHNDRWAEGQAGSVHVGLAAAEANGHEAAVIGLADQPGVPTEAWRRVAAAMVPIAVAVYAGRRANPVRLHREVWRLLPTEGDEGARTLMRLRPELVTEVPCPGDPADIDTVEDLTTWNS
jgi:molybdenum cofactor cytidylyltransferase